MILMWWTLTWDNPGAVGSVGERAASILELLRRGVGRNDGYLVELVVAVDELGARAGHIRLTPPGQRLHEPPGRRGHRSPGSPHPSQRHPRSGTGTRTRDPTDCGNHEHRHPPPPHRARPHPPHSAPPTHPRHREPTIPTSCRRPTRERARNRFQRESRQGRITGFARRSLTSSYRTICRLAQ